MPQKSDKCCAACGYLTSDGYCKRYNIFMLDGGDDLTQCTCECFATSDELADVFEIGKTKKSLTRVNTAVGAYAHRADGNKKISHNQEQQQC